MSTPVRTRVNLFRNATTELGTSGIWRAGTGTGATVSRDTTKFRSGVASVRIGDLTASTTLGETRWLTVAESTQGSTLRWATYVNPSQTWDFVPLWEGVVTSTGAYAGGNGTTLGPRVTCPAGQWTRIVGTLTLAADRTANRLGVLAVGNAPIGFGINTDDGIAVVNDDLPPYFDGSSPRSVEEGTRYSLTHEWAATPHDSNSIQKAYAQEVITPTPRASGTEWRYIASRLNGDGTETFLDWDLPLTNVNIDDVLSGVNGLSGKISPEVARLKDSQGLPLFEEWSTAIYAEHGGEIRGGGILTHSGFNGPAWELECGGFVGYWKEMPYVGAGAHYVKTDTLDIVRDIVDHVQDQEGSDIALVPDNDKSGILVGNELASEQYDPEGGAGGLTLQSQAYKLRWYADHDLLSNINGLAEDTPFDYRERHYWNGDQISHRLEFGVPKLGRRRDNLRFVVGENVFVKPAVTRSGEDYANEVYVLGAGEGAKMIRGHASVRRNRLRRVAVISDSSLRKVYRADSVAQTELRWRQQLDDFTTLTVRDHSHAPIGSMEIGDEIYIEGETGWVELGAWCRILGRSIRPDAPGVMELSVARTDRLVT